MVTRQYKWEDLEELRKFFKMSLEDVAREVKTTRQTLYSAMKGSHSTNPEYKSQFWAMHVGMAWEIFAINLADQKGITNDVNTNECYGLLVEYIHEMNKNHKNKQIDFDDWYWEVHD